MDSEAPGTLVNIILLAIKSLFFLVFYLGLKQEWGCV